MFTSLQRRQREFRDPSHGSTDGAPRYFADDGITATNETVAGQLRLSLRAYGYGANTAPMSPVAPVAVKNRVEYRQSIRFQEQRGLNAFSFEKLR